MAASASNLLSIRLVQQVLVRSRTPLPLPLSLRNLRCNRSFSVGALARIRLSSACSARQSVVSSTAVQFSTRSAGDTMTKQRLNSSFQSEDEEDKSYEKRRAPKRRNLGPKNLQKHERAAPVIEENGSAAETEDAVGLSKRREDAKPEDAANGAKSEDQDASYLSSIKFEQFNISPLTLKAVKASGFEFMTLVQAETLPVILKGKDVLAKAKTGTGKTVAFLLPAVEIILKEPATRTSQYSSSIFVVVVCPTRELATQAAAEANKLLKYHADIGTQVVIGGTNIKTEQKKLKSALCQILVCTPGRLLDHIQNTPGFQKQLNDVKMLVLDEADRLLDMGFQRDIERIARSVPKERQTLLFSATVPYEVHKVSEIALRRDHEFINTVVEGDEETHSKVSQSTIVAPVEDHFHILYKLLQNHVVNDPNYKVLVFCTTARVTALVHELLAELRLNVRVIHSRKSQSFRTKVSDEFRRSKGLILVSSDVSARGVDYPDVTLVVQVGVPSDREQYIHRLGRTGRKGKEGEGILLLAPYEGYFLQSVKDLPITKVPAPDVDLETKMKVQKGICFVEMGVKAQAYQAWLGYYNSIKQIGGDKFRLVELAHEFSHSMGLDKPPEIPRKILSKMGLANVSGLRSR